MNILFTCGGTAGHVNPAVALARIFQERHPNCQILFVPAPFFTCTSTPGPAMESVITFSKIA